MTALQILGLCMIALPLLCLFLFVAWATGWQGAVLMAAAVLLPLCLYKGMQLYRGEQANKPACVAVMT